MLVQIMGYGIIIAEIIGLTAYLPQCIHLLKIKNSMGISVTSWWLWFSSNLIYLLYGITIQDIFLIVSFIIATLANIVMITLIYRYKRK